MNEQSFITMIAAALMICGAGCGDTIVHDAYVEVAPVPKKATPEKLAAPPVGATQGQPTTVSITFDDLNLNLKGDETFREEMLTDRVKELIGKRVRLKGVMHGGVLNQKQIEEFVLLRSKDDKHGPGRPADTLAEAKMRAGEETKYWADRIEVEGTLRIEPKTGDDGNTWSLYILEEAIVDNGAVTEIVK